MGGAVLWGWRGRRVFEVDPQGGQAGAVDHAADDASVLGSVERPLGMLGSGSGPAGDLRPGLAEILRHGCAWLDGEFVDDLATRADRLKNFLRLLPPQR